MNRKLKRLTAIIEKIRAHDDWEPSHSSIKYDNGTIGYYDTNKKCDYFTVKYKGVGVNPKNDTRLEIEFETWKQFDNFNMNKWLKEIEDIMKGDVNGEV